MNISWVFLVLLTRALLPEVCEGLNVSVSPGPVAMFSPGHNATLTCRVSQRKRPSSLLVVRWLFSLDTGQEQLIVRMNVRRAQVYGNYTHRFAQPKVKFYEEKEGETYSLLIFNISVDDGGRYTCKVQEITKHHNRWRAFSNGTSTTELRVRFLSEVGKSLGVWHLFQDVYLCAVFICCFGLVCIFLFMVVLTCQYLHRKRRLRGNYHLVKCPQNSSGETVTSVLNRSSGIMEKERRKAKEKPRGSVEGPPEIPAKDKPRKPKLLKPQPKKVILPRVAEDCLTYAELELAKPQPEAKSACTGTVYAQILFEEQHL